MDNPGQRFYTAAELAELLRVDVVTIYRAVRDGTLDPVRLRPTGPMRFPAGDVEEILEGVAPRPKSRALARGGVVVS